EAALEANAAKRKVLAPEGIRATVQVVLEPLRRGVPQVAGGVVPWEVVPHLRVLGVTMTDPALGSVGLGPVEATVRGKVIAPLKRLCAEMEAGARRSTAFFLARRFMIPNLMYHMQARGLHADPRLWEEVDGVLTEFTALLSPLDLRDARMQ